NEYPSPPVVEDDFARMATNGINAIRTYTMPPRWLLDLAEQYGLRVMVSLAVERHIGYLADGKKLPSDIEHDLRSAVRRSAGHPAILCYAVGNEIPAPLVRWLGRERVERHLKHIHRLIKMADPGGLVT